MAITSKQGLFGQYHSNATPDASTQAVISVVHADGTVDAVKLDPASFIPRTGLVFVDVGGTPPAPGTKYFQAIDATT